MDECGTLCGLVVLGERIVRGRLVSAAGANANDDDDGAERRGLSCARAPRQSTRTGAGSDGAQARDYARGEGDGREDGSEAHRVRTATECSGATASHIRGSEVVRGATANGRAARVAVGN